MAVDEAMVELPELVELDELKMSGIPRDIVGSEMDGILIESGLLSSSLSFPSPLPPKRPPPSL